MKKVIGVKFNNLKKIYYFLVNDNLIDKGDFVICEVNDDCQFGVCVTNIFDVDESKLNFELKSIIRKAMKNDIVSNEKNMNDAFNALNDAKRFSKQLSLDIQFLDAYFTFDRKQLVISFLADNRVDFRELVKKLASVYKTRIELRQIGVRDKAKFVGGYGQCGRSLCCSNFLNNLNSVSINMAKNQNLSLNPQKINGICGRLMCCLSFENDNYYEYKNCFPRVGERVSVNGDSGKVISIDIFSRSYKVETDDSKIITVFLDKGGE